MSALLIYRTNRPSTSSASRANALSIPPSTPGSRRRFPDRRTHSRRRGRRSRPVVMCSSRRRPDRARRSRRFSRPSTISCAKVWRARCPTKRPVVYVSPLKALSNDIQRNLEAPLAGIRAELAALGYPDVEIRTLVRTGDTPQSERAEHAPPPAADRRHDAGVAVRAAGLGVRPQDALDDADGDRRRDPRARPEQAGEPSRAVARAPRRAHADASGAHRACRRRRSRSRRSRGISSERRRAPSAARSSTSDTCASAISPSSCRRRRSKRSCRARSGNRSTRGSRRSTLEHRTTLVFVNTRRMAERVARHLVRADRQGCRHRAPRKPRQGAPVRRRATAEERPAARAGGHGVARARHRHRRRRARLPARHAALDRDVPAARRTRQSLRRRAAEGAALSAVARRARRVRGAARCRAARRARPHRDTAEAARRARAAGRRRSGGVANGARTRCSASSPAPIRTRR